MAQPTSDEKRADIIRHMKAGKAKADIAGWLFVCVRTVTRVWNRHEETGSCAPAPPNCGRKPLVSEETMDGVVSRVKEAPDTTLLELIDEFDLPISQAALSKRLIGLGMRYKKNAPPELPEARGRRGGEGRVAVKPKRGGRGKHVLAR
jgi:transposase